MDFKVPFVNYPLQYQNLKSEIDETIQRVLSRGDLILRKDVENFEKNLAEFVGTRYAVGVNSCTDALIFALKAAGIKAGDEVITVSHTFFASIEAIVHSGATPVLVDVGKDFLMDPDKIEQAITPRTRAILPVHLNGRVCDMEKIMAIARSHNLLVIEDAAQALGARFGGTKAGAFGLAGCFSFYPAKLLGAFGDAGAVVTNDENIAEQVRLLRNHGMKKTLDYPPTGGGDAKQAKTEFVLYGFTSRMDNLQAAILNIKMKYLDQWIERRREIAKLYNECFADISEVQLPPRDDEKHFDVYQNYVLRAQKRDELFAYLKEHGVETLIKDPVPLHWQPIVRHLNVSLPYSEQLAKEVISLPMYPELTNEKIAYVGEQVREFYKR